MCVEGEFVKFLKNKKAIKNPQKKSLHTQQEFVTFKNHKLYSLNQIWVKDIYCTPIIFKNLIQPDFSIRNKLFSIFVGRVWIEADPVFIFLQKSGFNGIIKGIWHTNSNDHYFVFLNKLKMTSKSHKWLIYISWLTIIVDLDILSDHLRVQSNICTHRPRCINEEFKIIDVRWYRSIVIYLNEKSITL